MIETNKANRFKIIHYGELIDGSLVYDRQQLKRELAVLKNGSVEIRIQNHYKHRSNQQNRLMWLWLTIIANEIGYHPMEVKGLLQAKFLMTEKVIEATGEVLPIVIGTSELDTAAMTEFLDNVSQWAATYLGIDLPLPTN